MAKILINDKSKSIIYIYISCVILLLALTILGFNYFKNQQTLTPAENNSAEATELLEQLNKDYEIAVTPGHWSQTFADSINHYRAEQRDILQGLIVKNLTEKLTSQTDKLSQTILDNNKILFAWSSILTLILLISVMSIYIGLRSLMKQQIRNIIKQQNVPKTENKAQVVEETQNSDYDDLYNTTFEPIEDSVPEKQIPFVENQIISNNVDELEKDDLTELATPSPIQQSVTEVEHKKDPLPESKTLAIQYENELMAIHNEQDSIVKQNMLENFLIKLNQEHILDQGQYDILYHRACFYLGQSFYDTDNVDKAIGLYTKIIDDRILHPKVYFERGNAYRKILEYDKAIDDYANAIKLDSKYGEAFLQKGILEVDMGNYKKAIEDLTKAITNESDKPDAHYYRGIAYKNTEQYSKAFDDMNEVVSADITYAKAYYEIGQICQKLGKSKKALTSIETAIQYMPENAEAYNLKGIILANKGKRLTAIDQFSEALKLNPEFTEVYVNRGDAYYNLREYQMAITNYNQALALDPNLAEILQSRGNAFFFSEEYDKAIDDYDVIIDEVEGANTEVLLKRGISYLKTGQNEKAEKDLNALLEIDPDNAEGLQYMAEIDKLKTDKAEVVETAPITDDFDMYMKLAISQFNQNNLEDAIINFNKAQEINPDNAQLYYMRGLTFNYMKDFDAAIANFNKSLELQPDNADVYYSRGNSHANQQNFDAAINDYTQSIFINSTMIEPYFNRANIHYNKGQFEKAIDDYTKAIELNPQYTKAHFNRGLTYKASQEYAKAVDDFNIVISLEPKGRLTDKAHKQIEHLNNVINKKDN